MPMFRVHAITSLGATIDGTFCAESEASLQPSMREARIYPLKVERVEAATHVDDLANWIEEHRHKGPWHLEAMRQITDLTEQVEQGNDEAYADLLNAIDRAKARAFEVTTAGDSTRSMDEAIQSFLRMFDGIRQSVVEAGSPARMRERLGEQKRKREDLLRRARTGDANALRAVDGFTILQGALRTSDGSPRGTLILIEDGDLFFLGDGDEGHGSAYLGNCRDFAGATARGLCSPRMVLTRRDGGVPVTMVSLASAGPFVWRRAIRILRSTINAEGEKTHG